jgi:L-amino acid N-acyltransferase YncA
MVTLIRPATLDDAEAVARIYNHYIRDTIVTFEEDVVSIQEMAGRLGKVTAGSLPWVVVEESGSVLGYAYASTWHGRCAYRFSTEITVYLAPGAQGKGLGSKLYDTLFARLKDKGIHTVIGGIALPNPASVALHEKFGMTQVAHFKEVGFKFGQWIDVGYWQGLL